MFTLPDQHSQSGSAAVRQPHINTNHLIGYCAQSAIIHLIVATLERLESSRETHEENQGFSQSQRLTTPI
jgi:hypothetical protein